MTGIRSGTPATILSLTLAPCSGGAAPAATIAPVALAETSGAAASVTQNPASASKAATSPPARQAGANGPGVVVGRGDHLFPPQFNGIGSGPAEKIRLLTLARAAVSHL
jgi:hypothetical protein